MEYLVYEPISDSQDTEDELYELAIHDAWIRATNTEGGG